MRRRVLLQFLAPLLAAFHLAAGVPAAPPKRFTAPIPPEVWALRDDPALKDAGAVVLEDRWRLGLEDGAMERILRIRILNASGMAGAGLGKTADQIVSLEGRISYPDGSSLALEAASDLHEKTWYRVQGFWAHEMKRSILEVPGLTPDCVCELALRMMPDPRGGIEAISLDHPFPTREMAVELRNGWHESIYFRLDPAFKAEQTHSPGGLATIFRNLPATEETPFSAGFLSRASRLYIYRTQVGVPEREVHDVKGFWKDVAQEMLKVPYDVRPLNYAKQVQKGKGFVEVFVPKKHPLYDNLLGALGQDLPAAPQARALELYARLGRKVRYLPYMSQEYVKWIQSMTHPLWTDYPMDMEPTIESGVCSSYMWFTLYFNLLRDLGVHADLLMVSTSLDWPFLANLRTVDQFDQKLLRVTEEGRPPLFLDPVCLDGHPEWVPEACQGVEALSVETRTWTPGTLHLPWQAPEEDLTELAWTLDPGPSCTRFQVRAAFHGEAESRARATFEGEDAPARQAHLSRLLEARDLDLRVDEGSSSEGSNKAVPFTWTASGRINLAWDEGQAIRPFPSGTGLPYWTGVLPAARTEPIYLGPPRVQRWSSRVNPPRGYRCLPEQPQELTFPFASLRRTATPAPDGLGLDVLLEVKTLKGVAPPSDYGAFRNFLAALPRLLDASVRLEKLP